MILLVFQTGQQYSTLLLTIVFNETKGEHQERCFVTEDTEDPRCYFLSSFQHLMDMGVHEQSFERSTLRSLTVCVGSIVSPFVKL